MPCSGSVQFVSRRLPFAKTRVNSNITPHATCGGQYDTGTGLSARSSVWSYHVYSGNGPNSLIYLSPVLRNICGFSPHEITHLK